MSVPNTVSCSPRHTVRDVVSLLSLCVLIMYESEQEHVCLCTQAHPLLHHQTRGGRLAATHTPTTKRLRSRSSRPSRTHPSQLPVLFVF